MYGLVVADGEAYEKFAKEVEFTDCLSGRLSVTRADSEFACSDVVSGKDFVIIQSDASGVIAKVILKFSFAASGIGNVNIRDCGGDYTIVYRGHCKAVFGDDFFNRRYTCEEFLCRLDGLVEKQTSNSNVNKVADFFMKVGLYANLSGYNLLLSAVKYSLGEPQMLLKITTKLYPKLAETYRMTVKAVERDIRRAIETTFIKGKIIDVANKYYGANFSANEKPTNSEFIAYLTTIAQR